MTGYYDTGDAEARIEALRPVLEGLRDDRDIVARTQARLEELRAQNGQTQDSQELDLRRQEMGATIKRMEAAVKQIDTWGIALRDISTGLVDFPTLVDGRPAWLCWKLGEEHVTYRHERDETCERRVPAGA